MAATFMYTEASDIGEASRMLLKYKGKAFIMAGGTDLLVNIRNGNLRPQCVIDLHLLRGMKEIIPLTDGGVRIGALATLSQVASHSIVQRNYQALHEAILTVGSPQIRNVGTVAGNICNASPAADTAPALLIFEARLNVVGPEGGRALPIREFFKGPGQTALDAGEIVESIDLPLPPESSASCYIKLGRTHGMDLAVVGVGVLADRKKETRLAFASVGPTPLRVRPAEKILSGNLFEAAGIQKAVQSVLKTIQPVSDVRASREYRTAMTAVLMKQALERVRSRLSTRGMSGK